jgi:hypothetical protein
MAKHQFDLNEQWRLYLQRVGLTEEQMSEVQRTETKRAFYGAAGQLLILLRDDVGRFPEPQAVQILEDMMAQVMNFWMSQTSKQN